jgi:CRISPR-associated protein Cas2
MRNSAHRRSYLICYDICNPRRLRRVHRIVRDIGFPIQYSVFEAELDPVELSALLNKLESEILVEEDKVYFYRVASKKYNYSLGLENKTDALDFL